MSSETSAIRVTGTRSLRRLAAMLLLPALLYAGTMMLLLLMVPLQLTLHHDKAQPPLVLLDGERVAPVQRPRATVFDVTITNVSNERGMVHLAFPVPDGESRMIIADMTEVTGDWTLDSGGQRIESVEPGSRLHFYIKGRQPRIDFVARPDGGLAELRYNGVRETLDLRAAEAGFRHARLTSDNAISIASIPFDPLAPKTRLTITGTAAGAVSIGPVETLANFKVRPDAPARVDIALAERIGFAHRALLRFLLFSGAGLALIVLCTLIGASISRAFGAGAMGQTGPLGMTAVGLSLLALASNSLAYVLPADRFALPLSVVVAVLAGVGLWLLVRHWPSQRSSSAFPVSVIAATAAGIGLSFWPAGLVGQFFLGYLQTDSFFYTSVANKLQTHAMLDLMEAGSIIGYGMHSIDLALAAALASMTGTPTPAVWVVLAIGVAFLPPLATYRVILRWLDDGAVARITAIAVALSAPLASLFIEVYLVQYLFSSVLFLAILQAQNVLRAIDAGSPLRLDLFGFVTTSVFAGLLYPYFALLPVIAAGVMAWRLLRRGGLLRHAAYSVAVAAVAGNAGYLVLMNHAAAAQFAEGLNGIARWVVFPFYAQPKFPAFLAGLSPFHLTEHLVGQIAPEVQHPGAHWFARYYVELSESGAALAVVLFILVAAISCALVQRARLSQGIGQVFALSVPGYALLLAVAWQFSGLYALCKLAWTVACLLPLVIVPPLALVALRRGKSRIRSLRAVSAVALAVLIGGNALARGSDPLLWLAHPDGSVGQRYHAPLADQLVNLERWLARGDVRGGPFAYVESAAPPVLRGQRWSVLAGHASAIMRPRGFRCINCQYETAMPYHVGFERLAPDVLDAATIVVLGERPDALVPGWRLKTSSDSIGVHNRSTADTGTSTARP